MSKTISKNPLLSFALALLVGAALFYRLGQFYFLFLPALPAAFRGIESTASSTSFLVFGDSGTGSYRERRLADLMLHYRFDFLIHTGDIAYENGSYWQLQHYFFDIYKPHLSRAPVFPVPGNHDYET